MARNLLPAAASIGCHANKLQYNQIGRCLIDRTVLPRTLTPKDYAHGLKYDSTRLTVYFPRSTRRACTQLDPKEVAWQTQDDERYYPSSFLTASRLVGNVPEFNHGSTIMVQRSEQPSLVTFRGAVRRSTAAGNTEQCAEALWK